MLSTDIESGDYQGYNTKRRELKKLQKNIEVLVIVQEYFPILSDKDYMLEYVNNNRENDRKEIFNSCPQKHYYITTQSLSLCLCSHFVTFIRVKGSL